MTFVDQAREVFDSTFFNYFIAFIASTNVIGYLILDNPKAVIFFAFVAAVTYMFSKKVSFVLLVAILLTNTFMTTTPLQKEGFEGTTDKPQEEEEEGDEDEENILDPEIAKGVKVMKNNNSLDDARKQLSPPSSSSSSSSQNNNNNGIIDGGADVNEDASYPTDFNNVNMNIPLVENNAPAASELNTFRPMGSRSMGIKEAYENVDQILGNSGIQQLTKDTQLLMQRQQELFKTMEGMSPLLMQAQQLLSGFDAKSTKGVSGMATPLA